MRGRPAALPTAGYRAPVRLLLDEGRCTVQVTSEDGRRSKDFDFTVLPVARDIQVAFATAFDRRTGPSGTCKSLGTAAGCYYGLKTFAEYLSTLPVPPSAPGQLLPAHLEGYRDTYAGQRTLAQRVNGVKRALRAMDGVDDAFCAALRSGGINRDRTVNDHVIGSGCDCVNPLVVVRLRERFSWGLPRYGGRGDRGCAVSRDRCACHRGARQRGESRCRGVVVRVPASLSGLRLAGASCSLSVRAPGS